MLVSAGRLVLRDEDVKPIAASILAQCVCDALAHLYLENFLGAMVSIIPMVDALLSLVCKDVLICDLRLLLVKFSRVEEIM
ncbi:hypothetical protein Tsubulata_009001 [Turnera subulata]|uniref:Uncharacterized protein n=1 Tax=Turnera subulata TaxID=218843 RepID=A0A9Q0FIR6_9ROSI|nr:hypothetical protein Tsubulata_009001 [Turnera subulata]